MNIAAAVAMGATAVFAIAGTTETRAADPNVLTIIDVCDALGMSGLTISSATNCVIISGEIEYTFVWGDYATDRKVIDDLSYAGSYDVFIGNGTRDWESTVETSLEVEGITDTNFGPARGVVVIEGTDEVVFEDLAIDDETHELVLDEAYVAIGDNTVLMAGLKSTIVNDGDDTSFTYQEMFNEDEASGVGYNSDSTDTDIDDEGHVIQVVHEAGNGFIIGAALEDLDDLGTAVGIIEYAGDRFDAHVTFVADKVLTGLINDWAVHAGATLVLDNFQVRGAIAFNNDDWWNALATAEAEFDIFTVAVGTETTSAEELGFAGSVAAELFDGMTMNVASRAFIESDDDTIVDSLVEVEFEASETITLIAGGGYIHESDSQVGIVYGRTTLEWTPSSGFEGELTARVHHRRGMPLGYELKVGAVKSFE